MEALEELPLPGEVRSRQLVSFDEVVTDEEEPFDLLAPKKTRRTNRKQHAAKSLANSLDKQLAEEGTVGSPSSRTASQPERQDVVDLTGCDDDQEMQTNQLEIQKRKEEVREWNSRLRIDEDDDELEEVPSPAKACMPDSSVVLLRVSLAGTGDTHHMSCKASQPLRDHIVPQTAQCLG
ncbi:MAG: hypothetical protein SGPRY_011838, partial [Prymnesium sp.]